MFPDWNHLLPLVEKNFAGGAFQLWTAASSGAPSIRQITSDLGLDASHPSGRGARSKVEFKNHAMVVVAQWVRARFPSRRRAVRFRARSDEPDLHTQFESLLDQVWRSESDWRLWDRLDAAEKADTLREKRARDIKKAA